MIIVGDVLEQLRKLPSDHFDCVVTSPPYWGLRDYGTASWEGGDPECDHKGMDRQGKNGQRADRTHTAVEVYREICGKCGAKRIDQQLGLEPTLDEHIAKMVEVCAEIWRVLKPTGTFWLNYGDCYAASAGTGAQGTRGQRFGRRHTQESLMHRAKPENGLKPKDLCMIPNRLAIALQEPFYTGRIKAERDRVWMAAMIDGEGTICGFRHERKDSGQIRTGALVFITNGNQAILNECDRIWPGARYIEHLKEGDEVLGAKATRDCWRWQLVGAEDRALFLREIFPYLVAKKKQAAVAYALTEFSIQAKTQGRHGDSAEVKAKRDVLAQLLTDLNQNRPCDIPSWVKEPPKCERQGWWVRSECVWGKSNPMPESVTDRPATSHEKIFLLTKAARYHYDGEAVRQTDKNTDHKRHVIDPPASHVPNASAHSKLRTAEGRQGQGRNLRNYEPAPVQVWEMATAPFPGAHFATFPPELVQRCLLAGTSQKGYCADCGAPWVREVSSSYDQDGSRSADEKYNGIDAGLATHPGVGRAQKSTQTIGWSPSCQCHGHFEEFNLPDDWIGPRTGKRWVPDGKTPAPIPARVLDPFGGAGTVGLVADSMGLDWTLIELNPEYAAMAEARIKSRVAKHDAPKAPVCADTLDMFG